MSTSRDISGPVVVVVRGSSKPDKSIARFFGSKKAKVVLAEVEGSEKPEAFAEDIKNAGGSAICIHGSLDRLGEKAVEHAIKSHGRIDILLFNGVKSIAMTSGSTDKTHEDGLWKASIEAQVSCGFKCVRAAWSQFKKQGFGRILFIVETHGYTDGFLSSAANFALIGLANTIGIEGLKNNILCNMIVLKSNSSTNAERELMSSLAAVLVDRSNTKETRCLFFVDRAHVARLRWQRSAGMLLKPNETMTAGLVLSKLQDCFDFSKAVYPLEGVDWDPIIQKTRAMADNDGIESPDFSGKVVIVTGAAAGLGRSYVEAFARLGASVVINDVGDPEEALQDVIRKGGKAVSHRGSAENGQGIVQTALEAFGRVDVLVNNAGIVRDKSLPKMDDRSWKQVLDVHLRGSYNTIRAAWPHMVRQRSGRIVNTTSISGIYGNFGQANYSAAKAGIIGLSQSFARAGAPHNISVNTIAPAAGTAMSRSVIAEDIVTAMKPEWNAPFVVALCSDSISPPTTGLIFEAGPGFMANTRWQRSIGYDFSKEQAVTPERMLEVWPQMAHDFKNQRERGNL